MVRNWFFSWGTHQFGPFSAQELSDLASLGRLQPSDMVWKEGMTTGVLASRVKHLFGPPPVTIVSQIPAETMAELLPPVVDVCHIPNDPPAQEQAEDTANLPDETVLVSADITPTNIYEGLESGQGEVLVPEAKDPPAVAASVPANGHPGASLSTDTPAKKPRPSYQDKPKKMMVMAGPGVIVCGQDGEMVTFKKKCIKCGLEDTGRRTVPIRNGLTRISFFCPKCRKNQEGEIRGMIC